MTPWDVGHWLSVETESFVESTLFRGTVIYIICITLMSVWISQKSSTESVCGAINWLCVRLSLLWL